MPTTKNTSYKVHAHYTNWDIEYFIQRTQNGNLH